MADTKISALTAAGALAGTEPVPIVQGAATVRTTVQDIANLASPPAASVTYDNTTSGLTATNVQAAIDEVLSVAQQQVVGGAPTIAQTTWMESVQLTMNDPGFFGQQSGYVTVVVTSANAADRAISFVTGAGTASNWWQRRANSPTFNMRVGAVAYGGVSRGAAVISNFTPAEASRMSYGASPANNSASISQNLIGVQRDESNNWSIVVRNQNTELVTPVSLPISGATPVLVCVEVVGDGSNVVQAKVGVFNFATGVLIDKVMWTGSVSTGWTALQFEAWTSRPSGSGAVETMRILYMAWGPVPSPTLNPFFAQL